MEQKQAIADRLKQSNNILITVSSNPTVDQLSSCLGLTLALNKMGKHATAVFSGNVPSTIEFLQPEKTIEKNTDSLRDFIIALDKAKADKLRYKVEDKVVKIFITPYKTSITDKDLQFSQGDFNVDVVIALGVHNQGELDQAITAHGRILHDAVVTTINTKSGGELGTINWVEPSASSLSELVAELVDSIDPNLMDGQMATAMLTGIVAETERFSNEKTTPTTMSISAVLMSAGANQQLVATKLQAPPPPPPAPAEPPKQEHESPKLQEHKDQDVRTAEDGTLEINHPLVADNAHAEEQPEAAEEHHEEPWHEDQNAHAAEPAQDDRHGQEPEHHDESAPHEEPQPSQRPWQPEASPPPEERHDEAQQEHHEEREERPREEPFSRESHFDVPVQTPEQPKEPAPQIRIDDEGTLGLPPLPPQQPAHITKHNDESFGSIDPTQHMASSHMIMQPPAVAGSDIAGMAPASDDEERPAGEPLQLPGPEHDTFGGTGNGPANAGGGMFGSSASANITSPSMPYLPPSMTPGGAPADDDTSGTPGPAVLPPQLVEPTDPNAHPPLPPQPVTTPEPQVVTGTGLPSYPAMPPMSVPEPAGPTGETLSQLEANVNSPHIGSPAPAMQSAPMNDVPAAPPPPTAPTTAPPTFGPPPQTTTAASQPPQADQPDLNLTNARDAVMQAIAGGEPPIAPEPIVALNAQPLGAPLHENTPPMPASPPPMMPAQTQVNTDASANPTFTLPDVPDQPGGTPPAAPPPMMPLGQ